MSDNLPPHCPAVLGVVQTRRELSQPLWFWLDQHGWGNDHDQHWTKWPGTIWCDGSRCVYSVFNFKEIKERAMFRLFKSFVLCLGVGYWL